MIGDNAQFSIALKHIRAVNPDWEIHLQSPLGTGDIYRGLVDSWQPIRYPWNQGGYDKNIYIHFAHPLFEWGDSPSSKARQCLTEELPTHGINIEADDNLFSYNCVITDEQKNRVGEWVESLPENKGLIFIHPEGNSMPEEKNLSPFEWTEFYQKVKLMGYLPINLNFRSPEYDMGKLWNHGEFRGDKVIYGDAGMILEVLNQGTLLLGIDSGIEHLATLSECPTAIIWKCHHPLFCFDLSPNNEGLIHYVPKECKAIVENEFATEYFEDNYNHKYFDCYSNPYQELLELLAD